MLKQEASENHGARSKGGERREKGFPTRSCLTRKTTPDGSNSFRKRKDKERGTQLNFFRRDPLLHLPVLIATLHRRGEKK